MAQADAPRPPAPPTPAPAAPAPAAPAPTAPAPAPAPAQPATATSTSTAPASVPQADSGTHYRFDPFVPNWLLVALAALILLGVRRAYQRSTRAIRPEYKLVLAAIRLSAFGLLLLCLSRPVSVRTHALTERGLCFMAVDSSGSMNLKDMPGRRSRWDCASELLKSRQADLEQLGTQFELHRYLFDGSVHETPKLPGEQGSTAAATGTSTDLVAVMEKLANESGGSSSAGALLISDGRHNLPSDVVPAAQALGRAGIPLCIIGVGQDETPGDFKDVAVKQLIVPEKAFIGGRTIFRVEIESTLKKSESVPLTVDVDGKKIFEREVVLQPGVNHIAPEIEVPFIPDVLGLHRVTATVGMVPEEANVINNTASAFFRVYRTKIGVWYLEGAVRKEFGSIRSALETAPNVSFKAVNAFMTNSAGGGGAGVELLPTKQEDWDQLRLVIIGDLPAVRFEESALRNLAHFVEDGGSVLMIGGKTNFGAGGWQNSPLADVFPVEMSAVDGQEPGPLNISPVPEQFNNTILNVGENFEDSASAWTKLAPLPGVNRFTALRPLATVLLKAGKRDLLVVQEYGQGRSAVFTADTTWQWVLKSNQPAIHRKFWRNLVTWLTRSDYRDSAKAVYADSERLQYLVGEQAAFRAHVNATEKFKEVIKNARITLQLTRINGNVETPVFLETAGNGPGEYSKRFALGATGSYRFKVTALNAEGATIDSDSIDLQVTAPDMEVDNPRANLRLLRRIADLSGGKYFDYPNAAKAFEYLQSRPAGFSKPQTEVTELWDSGWIIALFVSLLSVEWLLRKKWGLV